MKTAKAYKSIPFLPYINKVTYRIGKVLHKHKIKTVYICETGHSVKTRLSQNRICLRTDLLSDYAVAEHQHNTGHEILFDSIQISFLLQSENS